MLHFSAKITDTDIFKSVAGPILEMYAFAPKKPDDSPGAIANAVKWLLRNKQQALVANPHNQSLQEEVDFIKNKLKS